MLVVIAAMAASCAGGPDISHYAGVLDQLTIPAGWELVHTTLRAPGGGDKDVDPSRPTDTIGCSGLFGECPSIVRYYLVGGQPVDAYTAAKQVMLDAGFDAQSDSGPTCDEPSGGPICMLSGTRESDNVRLTINRPGDDPNGLVPFGDDRFLVVIKATRM